MSTREGVRKNLQSILPSLKAQWEAWKEEFKK